VIDGQLPQLGEMCQTLRFERSQYGAAPGCTIEEMTQQHINWPGIRNVRSPVEPVRRQQAHQVIGSLELFVDFRLEGGA